MFNFTAVTAAQAYQYFAENEDDYWLRSQYGASPELGGDGCARMGFKPGSRGFTKEAFQQFLRSDFPSGDLPVQAARTVDGPERKARAAYDATFTVPKSVSIAALALGRHDIFKMADDAHREALELACRELRVRHGARGEQVREPTSGATWVSFCHATSRFSKSEMDGGAPNLHWHDLINAYAYDTQGNLRKLDPREIFAMQRRIDLIMKQALRARLEAAGIELRETKSGLELAYIPQSLIDEFSSGKRRIDAFLAEGGYTRGNAPAWMREVANLATRGGKDLKKSTGLKFDSMQAWWGYCAERSGNSLAQVAETLSQAQANRLARKQKFAGPGVIGPRDALIASIEHHTERLAHIRNIDALVFDAGSRNGFRARLEELEAAAVQLEREGILIRREDGRFTTKKLADAEASIERSYRAGINAMPPVAHDPQAVISAINAFEQGKGFTLSRGQRALVESTTLGRDQLVVAIGDAGTGKTTSFEVIRDISVANGLKVFGLAPSATAVSAMREAGIETGTAQGAKVSPQFWSEMSKGDVLICDELGLWNGTMAADILQKARERGVRVLAVGDHKQFQSVEAGAALYHLGRLADHALVQLEEMNRAKTANLREQHYLARDKPEEAMEKMYDRGLIESRKDRQAVIDAIASEYAGYDCQKQADSLVITNRNADRRALNGAIRDKLGLTQKQQVDISVFERKDLTVSQKKSELFYEAGDTVTVNRRFGPLRAGESLEVVGVKGDAVTLNRKNGQAFEFKPRVDGEKVTVGTENKMQLAEGDLVKFTASIKSLGIDNGDRARVLGFSEGRDEQGRPARYADVERAGLKPGARGRIARIELRDRGCPLTYGYAITGHSAQGHTAKGAVLMTMFKDDGLLNKNSFYTNVTRSTKELRVFTDAKTSQDIGRLMSQAQTELAPDTAREVQKIRKPAIKDAVWVAGSHEHAVSRGTRYAGVRDTIAAFRQLYPNARRVELTGSDRFRAKFIRESIEKAIGFEFADKRSKRLQRAVLADITAERSRSSALQDIGDVEQLLLHKRAASEPCPAVESLAPEANEPVIRQARRAARKTLNSDLYMSPEPSPYSD